MVQAILYLMQDQKGDRLENGQLAQQINKNKNLNNCTLNNY